MHLISFIWLPNSKAAKPSLYKQKVCVYKQRATDRGPGQALLKAAFAREPQSSATFVLIKSNAELSKAFTYKVPFNREQSQPSPERKRPASTPNGAGFQAAGAKKVSGCPLVHAACMLQATHAVPANDMPVVWAAPAASAPCRAAITFYFRPSPPGGSRQPLAEEEKNLARAFPARI